MDINDKSTKSCAIKVHLANLIKRKSHVTLVVSESSAGLLIKRLAMKKIGMNEHQIMLTELFVSVKDSFRSFPNHEDNDASNFFHVLDADCPGHYVNLRLCEFHLYWKDSLPQSLENPVDISKFQSRASLGDKLSLAAKKYPFDQSSNFLNGQLKPKCSSKEISQLPLANTFSQNYTKMGNGVIEIEKPHQNRISSSTLNLSKSNLYKSETELNGNGDSKLASITSEIKCRPSLFSVKKALSKSKEQEALKTVREVHNPPVNKNVLNSPSSSSFSSISLERSNSLSMSMPVLNKYTIRDKNKTNLPVGSGDRNNKFAYQKVSSKSNLSDIQHDSTLNNVEKLAVRRQLPRVAIPDDVVEEKRYLLSKKLERKLSRRATIESKKFADPRPVQKCNSLMSWKDVIKFNREDSDDTGSLASQEVAEIMAEAGPMGMVESDYEEPRTSGLEDDDIASCSSKSNTFHSLFDSMKDDPLNDLSDFDDGKGTSAKSASLLDSSMASSKDSSFAKNFTTTSSSHGVSPSITHRVSHNVGTRQISSDRQLEENFFKLGSENSNFVLYSQLTRQSMQENTLTLFDILSLGYMKLFPLTIPLLERRTVGTRSRYLPFEVLSDVIRLKAIQAFNDKDCHEVVKTFAALKISEVSCNDSMQLSKFDENSKCQLGDLLVEVNHTNVLGFSVSQFFDFASKTLTKFHSIQVVVARPLKPS